MPAGGDVHFGTGLFAEDGTPPRRHRPRLSCRPVDRARQVFTDELTDVLGDPAWPANAEVLDGWFLVYHRNDDVVDPALWRHVFRTAGIVADLDASLRARP